MKEDWDEREEKRMIIRAAIRGIYYGMTGGLCFRYPVLLLFAALFMAYQYFEH